MIFSIRTSLYIVLMLSNVSNACGAASVDREVDNHDDSSEVSSSAGDQQTMSPATVGVTPIPPPSNSVIDGLGAQNSQASTMLNMLTQMLVLHQKSIAAAQLQQQQMLQAKEESSLVTVQVR